MTKKILTDVEIDGTLVASDGSVVPVGGTAEQVLAKASDTDYDTEWVAQSGSLLAAFVYNPSTGTGTDFATSSAYFADVDSSIEVTFTVPSSGSVLVRLNAVSYGITGSANATLWNLREGGANVPGTAGIVHRSSHLPASRATLEAVVTGLTPGASKTWRWGHARAGSGTAYTQFGGEAEPVTTSAYGPGVMTVWAVPGT